MRHISNNEGKAAAGKMAAELVQNGMIIGLGTGSTAAYVIAHLIERCHQGLQMKAVASSKQSDHQAMSGGIPMINVDEVVRLDMTIDGADEIDHEKNMIKGGGGALLREKILAYMSDEMVVVVDESKVVKQLGAFPLPLEIIPFGYRATVDHLAQMGYSGKMRKTENQTLYITENSNYILDVQLSKGFSPEKVNQEICSIPGVVETGLFLGMAGRVIIGQKDGHVRALS